jgi:hypothetical protein
MGIFCSLFPGTRTIKILYCQTFLLTVWSQSLSDLKTPQNDLFLCQFRRIVLLVHISVIGVARLSIKRIDTLISGNRSQSFQRRQYRCLPIETILIQFNPVHTLTGYFSKIWFQLLLGIPSTCFPRGYRKEEVLLHVQSITLDTVTFTIMFVLCKRLLAHWEEALR